MSWLVVMAALGLLYPYVLYPLLLAIVSRPQELVGDLPTPLPKVAILVSAFNEQHQIQDKIANFVALDYPPDRLELWIGTDGSTDRTAENIRQSANPRIRLVERAERAGKTEVLNDLAQRVHADVLVFTDVNALFRTDAVRRLVAAMADPRVGLVSGRTTIRSTDGNSHVEGAYYRFESWLKVHEGAWGWLPGADGAIYALRAKLYQALPPAWINDLAHPCQVAAQGQESVFEPLAISEESAGSDAFREFHRQTRITAQAAYLLALQTGLLLRHGRWGMLWTLTSHKWARWIAGTWILIGWVAITAISPVAGAAAAAVLVLLLAAWRFGAGWADLPVFFLLTHLAYLRGLGRALAGDRYLTWTPRAG